MKSLGVEGEREEILDLLTESPHSVAKHAEGDLTRSPAQHGRAVGLSLARKKWYVVKRNIDYRGLLNGMINTGNCDHDL